MSQQTDDLDEDFDDDQPQKPGVRQRMKALEEQNKKLLERDARASELERREAFRDAGIDLSSPLGKMFAKAFDGDVADAEALKAAAVEVGILKPPAPTTSKEEQAGHTRMLNAAVGSEPAPSQWTEADVIRATPAQVEAAEEAGLLKDYLGLIP